MLKYYNWSIVFAVIAVILGYVIAGPAGAGIVLILSVLETSLSFDNAVVNAKVLQNWDHVWRERFLMWGILIAVFGMRLVFPLAVVGVATAMGPIEVLNMALYDPDTYASTLTNVHYEIAAFGGAFLMMVFLKFFLDQEKDEHWVHFIEEPLSKVGKLDMIETAITMAIIIGISYQLDAVKQIGFIVAGIAGLITYILADAAGSIAGGEEEGGEKIIKAGIGGFMYLELLDASFSFDGVVGAFALSHNIFIIMLGLGVGAMFVRSMTIHLVEKGTLKQLKYLEHSAFWAIGALAFIMLYSAIAHVPEMFTGLIGAALISLGVYSSLNADKLEQ